MQSSSTLFKRYTHYEKTYRIKGLKELLVSGYGDKYHPFIQKMISSASFLKLPVGWENSASFMAEVMDWKLDKYTPDGGIVLRGANAFGYPRTAVCIGDIAINLLSYTFEVSRPKGIPEISLTAIREKVENMTTEDWNHHIREFRKHERISHVFEGMDFGFDMKIEFPT